jgi:hypothetical protein
MRLIIIVGIGGDFRPVENRVLSRYFNDLLKSQDANILFGTDAGGVLESAVEIRKLDSPLLSSISDTPSTKGFSISNGAKFLMLTPAMSDFSKATIRSISKI